jgi:hypothetical protein
MQWPNASSISSTRVYCSTPSDALPSKKPCCSPGPDYDYGEIGMEDRLEVQAAESKLCRHIGLCSWANVADDREPPVDTNYEPHSSQNIRNE